LNAEQWRTFQAEVVSNLRISPEVEWTLDCNPESFSKEKADAWHAGGVNRLSIGVQSMQPDELRILGRLHTPQRVRAVLSSPVLEKFNSIGVDIMYGIPGQTADSFCRTIDSVCAQGRVKHLSIYELTVAHDTRFFRHRKLLPFPDDETASAMMRLISIKAQQYGFERYEVSNFARPGFACRHNRAYWEYRPYVGLGPGAHSFLADKRVSNIKDVRVYAARLSRNELPVDFCETLDRTMREHEIIFLRLRTREGLSLTSFRELAGGEFLNDARNSVIQKYTDLGYIETCNDTVRLTDAGIAFADAIARELF
jgi:oxygen-independent coproporphyrinogen-3 oxidase